MIDLTDFKERTLFIIGNGFDIAHGIKSSYKDYHNWLLQHGYHEFVAYMESIFPAIENGEQLLWKDFEEAIGRYNPREIHMKYFQGVDSYQYAKETQLRVTERIKPFVDMIPKTLIEWARDIDYPCSPKYEGLTQDSKYLTFNYTKVLERVYGINQCKICHIHGCTEDEKIIVGHNHKRNPQDEDDNQLNIKMSRRNIVELMNKNEKPVMDIIKKNADFFNSLCNIQRIIVIGHSMGEVDIPYFEEISKRIKRDCIWHFYWHATDEQGRFYQLMHNEPFRGFTCRIHQI